MIILKYPLPEPRTMLLLPRGAVILSCQIQDGVPTLWVKADEVFTVPHTFIWVGTGSFVPENTQFIDTVQIGALVWHIFEKF